MGIASYFLRIAKPVVERFPSLAMTYRHLRDARATPGEPVATPMGFRFVGNQAMAKGEFEPDETAIATRILDKVDVFVDVGANVGYYCCIALQKAKRVVAFEPIRANLRCLYQNVLANGWEHQIEILPIALSNGTGIVRMFGGGTGASLIKGWAGAPEHCYDLVPTSTLDNVLGSRFHGKRCFILVDIEGAEQLMIEGASSLLSEQPKPIWMVEISVSEHQPQGVVVNPHLLSTFRAFWDKGYEAWTATKQLRLVQPEEVEAVSATGKDTLLTHNFLFVESGRSRELLGA